MLRVLTNAVSDIACSLSKQAYLSLPTFTDLILQEKFLDKECYALLMTLNETQTTDDFKGPDKEKYDRLSKRHNYFFDNPRCRLDGQLVEKEYYDWANGDTVLVHIKDDRATFISDRTYKFEYRGHIPESKERRTAQDFKRVKVGERISMHGLFWRGDNPSAEYGWYLAQARLFL